MLVLGTQEMPSAFLTTGPKQFSEARRILKFSSSILQLRLIKVSFIHKHVNSECLAWSRKSEKVRGVRQLPLQSLHQPGGYQVRQHTYKHMHINSFIIREFTKKRRDKQTLKKWMIKTNQGLWREAGEDECTIFDRLATPSGD